MIWRFAGEKFQRRVAADGTVSIMLDVSWHMFLPYMGGPAPLFDVEDVLAIFQKPLSINLVGADPSIILDAARNYFRATTGGRISQPEYQPSCMIICSNDIEITAAVTPTVMIEVERSLLSLAATSGPKCYVGLLHATGLLAGPTETQPSKSEVSEFLEGKRPLMATETPRLDVLYGTPVPSQPTQQELLRQLKGRI